MRLLFLLLLLVPAQVLAADWPQFRGLNSSGVADCQAPVEFGPGRNELWHVNVASGHSSPCVVGDHIYLTVFTPETQQLAVLCLDRHTGNTLWQQDVVATEIESGHPSFSPASSTVACDSHYVVAYFGSRGLVCLDTGGNQQWEIPMSVAKSYGGNAVSPVICGELVVLYRGCYAEHFLLAVDKHTGKERWKIKLEEEFTTDMAATATPIIHQNQLIIHSARAVQSFEVTSGKQLWSLPCSTTGTSTPVIAGSEVIVGTWNQTGEPALTPQLQPFTTMLADYNRNKNRLLEKDEFPELYIFHRSEGTEAPENVGIVFVRVAEVPTMPHR